MSTMITEVYEAFVKAGCPDDAAKKAAEALSSEQLATKEDIRRLEAKIEKEFIVIKWMLGVVLVAVVIPILRSIFGL